MTMTMMILLQTWLLCWMSSQWQRSQRMRQPLKRTITMTIRLRGWKQCWTVNVSIYHYVFTQISYLQHYFRITCAASSQRVLPRI